MKAFASIVALLLLSVFAHADVRVVKSESRQECDGRRCWLVSYEWRAWSEDPQRHYLYRDGVQVGAWCYAECHWRTFDGRTWGPAQDAAPLEVAGIESAQTPVADAPGSPQTNFGLLPGKISAKCRYTINGWECSKQQQFEAIAGGRGQLVDDSQKLHLAIVGPTEECRRVLADLDQSPALAEFKGQLHVQSYAPDHWAVTQRKLAPLGPGLTLFVRAPDGTDLMRDEGYSDGAEGLAKRLRRIRAPDEPLDGLRNLSELTNWLKRNWLAPVLLLAVAVLLLRGRPPR